jgi:hypothetical protein
MNQSKSNFYQNKKVCLVPEKEIGGRNQNEGYLCSYKYFLIHFLKP